MPKIQEYLPEQEAQGPVGQTTPMLEQVSMFGRGIEEFGRDLGDAYSVLHQRQSQVESADAAASVAEQREAYMEHIDQGTRDGSLDVEKVKQDYQKWAEKQSEQYNTTQGKDTFLRASSRTGGAILLKAARSKSVVMGNQAKENLNNLSISNSNVALKDPAQFDDLYQQQTEALQAQVEAKSLTPAEARQAGDAMSLELAKSAVRGWMTGDADNIKGAVVASGDKVDASADQFNKARTMLRSGAFDSFLNSDHKKVLEEEIRHNQQYAQTAGKQVNDQKMMAYAAKSAAWQSDAYDKLENNSLTPEEVQKAVDGDNPYLDRTVGSKMLHLIDQRGKEQLESDPAAKNRVIQNMLTPNNDPRHVHNPLDVAYMVKAKTLTWDDYKDIQAIGKLKNDPVLNQGMGQLLQTAREKMGKSFGTEFKMSVFTNDMLRAVKKASSSGEPVGDLFDPNSKSYFGNQLGKYLSTPQQSMAEQANAIRGGAPSPANNQIRPGTNPAPTSNSAQATDYGKMGAADISKLDPSKMSADEKAKVRARIAALRAGGK